MLLAPLATVLTDWLIAVGTVGALSVALFLQLLVPWYRKPVLTIPHGTPPEPLDDMDRHGVAGEWWDIPIMNDGRGDTARDAQVMVVEVTSAEGGRTRVPKRSLKWTHLDGATAELPAGMKRSVELGKIKPKGNGPLTLGLYPPLLGSDRDKLRPGNYRVKFAVVAINARPSYYHLDLVLRDGNLSFPDGVVGSDRSL